MRQVGIRKRSKRIVTLGVVMAMSALLSAFQPANAQVPPNETGHAAIYVQQGDFEIQVGAVEGDGTLCAWIRNVLMGESRQTCGYDHDVEVSDDLGTAWGRGTLEWASASSKPRGSKKQSTSYKYGTFSLDVTWTGYGLTTATISGPTCGYLYHGWELCPGASQSRAASMTGTVTDSEWGTFVLDGAGGYLAQQIL